MEENNLIKKKSNNYFIYKLSDVHQLYFYKNILDALEHIRNSIDNEKQNLHLKKSKIYTYKWKVKETLYTRWAMTQ